MERMQRGSRPRRPRWWGPVAAVGAAMLLGPPVAYGADRGYERVTPPHSDAYTALVGSVADNGRVFWGTTGTPVGIEPDGGSAITLWDWVASTRQPAEWTSTWITSALQDPPAEGQGGALILQTAPDGSKVLMRADGPMAPDDEDDVTDAYVVSADGSSVRLATGADSEQLPELDSFAASNDLSVVSFLTLERLAATDTDDKRDMYASDGEGVIHHVSVGSDGTDPGTDDVALHIAGFHSRDLGVVSADGSKIFFITTDSLVPGDTGGADLYMRENFTDTVRLTSEGADDWVSTRMLGASDDGRYVFLRTSANLVAEDSDGSQNVYRIDTVTQDAALMPNSYPSAGAAFMQLAGWSPDGQHAAWTDYEPLDAADTDGGRSLYRWDNGVVTYLGPAAPTDYLPFDEEMGPFSPDSLQPSLRFSRDGRVLAWSTAAPVAADDEDASEDVYVNVDGVTTRLSKGPGTGNAPVAAKLAGLEFVGLNNVGQQVVGRGMTDDGSVVYFTTAEPLLPEDSNTAADVYGAADGDLELITPGVGDDDAIYVDNTPDGTDVFFRTLRSLDGESGPLPGVWDARVGDGFPARPTQPSGGSNVGGPAPGGSGGTSGPPTPPTLPSAGPTDPGPLPPVDPTGGDGAGGSDGPAVRLGRDADLTRRAVRLTYDVSEPGRLVVRVKRPGSKKAGLKRLDVEDAGELQVSVVLPRDIRRTLRRAGRARVVVKTTFTGPSGVRETTRRTMVLRATERRS